MFSPTELISLVFANKNDIYYGDDLLKLNLNQYLWKELHKTYKTVYFLSASDKMFTVRTFGDTTANVYKPDTGLFWDLFGKERTKFGNWMLRQLRAKHDEAVAFVCSLEDFCSVFSDEQWLPLLDSIAAEKKRSGSFILTASTTEECTKELLLCSGVFDRLHEDVITDVRGGTVRDMYRYIRDRKYNSCFFLNTFTRERVRNLLLHVIMAHPKRMVGTQELDHLAEYLTIYLSDSRLQRCQPIFPKNLPVNYLSYRELYAQLENKNVWTRLEGQSAQYIRNSGRMPDPEGDEYSLVLRDPKCYAGKCMMLRLPGWLYKSDTDCEQLEVILRSIQREASAPKNRTENPTIVAETQGFLEQIDTVSNGNADSYEQLLRAIEFCMKWIYTEEDTPQADGVMRVISQLKSGISISEQCFALRRDLLFVEKQTASTLQTKTVCNLRETLKVRLEMRDRYEDLINASILGLSMSSMDTNITEQLSELQKEIEEFQPQVSQPPQTEEVVAEPEETDEDFFDFDDVDIQSAYNFIPPT